MSELLKNLNDPQKKAVQTTTGALLIIAGAGTGKTRVLVHRLAYILQNRLAMPWQCLCLTFTNKASIGLKLFRPYLDLIGLKAPFSIFDESDSKIVLKKIMKEMKLDTKLHTPAMASEKISRLKDKALLPNDIREINDEFADGKLLEIYKKYQKQLRKLNAVDFGDLILLPLKLIETHKEIAQKIAWKFKYILVDEYQDTNSAQYKLLKKLTEINKNICCVGDDDQSIYGWRGADIRNILNFQKDFPDAELIRLEENYRSTSNILKTASHLISNNKERLGKTVFTNINHKLQEKITINSFFEANEEAVFIAQKLLENNKNKIKWSEMAILIRSGYLSRSIEEQLIAHEIPYKTVGTIKFYERAEIKDALAYFRLISHPQDDLAFERIINTPRRGVGAVAISILHEIAKRENKNLFESLKSALETERIKGKTGERLEKFVKGISHFRERVETEDCGLIGAEILEKMGYLNHWEISKDADSSIRLEHLKDLMMTMKKYPSLPDFLEHIALISAVENLNEKDHVLLMTMHSAKGLEFDAVFLPAWEENIFPNEKAIEENSLEEERRLAYVGITRAKKQVMISHTASRFLFGTRQHNFPSIFIDELPTETTEIIEHSMQKESKNTKLKNDQIFSEDVNTMLIGRKINHKEFGVGEILDADTTELTIVFGDEQVEKLHANSVEFL
ncbi:MAG: hypothetical protein B6I23_03485 [Rickettsiaceae bacterium 4572_127]|nr:MAG: hypothetical protein B6I23_03485 [Rickettsiaceae bacterium 4572_127]